MNFTKMHGCGNDYIYMDCTKSMPADPNGLSLRLSDRHFGVGSDGLILICASDKADFRMRMYNADGSEGAMCGNGIRCVGKFVYDKGLTHKTSLAVETNAGIKYLDLRVENGKVASVRVDMGTPTTGAETIPVVGMGDPVIEKPISVNGREYLLTCVSTGSAHGILWVEDVNTCHLEEDGPVLENHPMFPDRCNIEFIHVVDESHIDMRVWERGSGETWACGTGATAAAYACYLTGKTGPSVDVRLRGGVLHIDYDTETGKIYMTGPATTVFEGVLEE